MGILNIFLSKDKHIRDIQFNNVLTVLSRGGGVICNLYIIPVTLNYLDKNNYGVWLTLTSVISWLSFMDVGLGNGMRNKLAESAETGSNQLLKQYVSTTYCIFAGIMLIFFILFGLVNPFIPWNSILKTSMPPHAILMLTYVVVLSFCLRLVLDLASMIVVALHKPYIKALVEFLFNALTLLLVYSLTLLDHRSLVLYGSIVSFVPVVVLTVFTLVLFNKKSKYNFLAPSIRYFNKALVPELFSLGMQFFIIQAAALVVFSTDNVLITQLFSPDEVTNFNIVYKYFSIITLGFSIVLMPYWSSFTSAFFADRIGWIKNAFKRLLLLWLGQVAAIAVFIFLAPMAYKLWIGRPLNVDTELSFWMGIYVILFNWNNLFVYFLNGISKIRLQMYSSILIAIINIPLAYFLVKHTTLGLPSIVISNCVCLLICSLWAPIQCFKILNGQATGFWNK